MRADDSRVHAAQQGGHVLEPRTGLHTNVWVFDFKSLYPSIIRTFNIDPLSYVADPAAAEKAGLIEVPGGAFRRSPGILPRMLDELFPRREAAKKAGDDVASNAIKILMNSFYGVLGTPACRFYNPALANSITGTGRELLLWSKRWFEAAGFECSTATRTACSYIHTLTIRCGTEQARQLVIALNDELVRYIGERWQVRSRMELEFEKLYLKLFLPRARHSTRGASKRYAGLLHGAADADNAEFVGMEVVRGDWTDLAKQVQRQLYRRLFTGQRVDAYLTDSFSRYAGALSTTRSSIARICGSPLTTIPLRRRRTSSRPANRHNRQSDSSGTS